MKNGIMTELPDVKKVSLMTFAGSYRFLTYGGCILSGISAVLALGPFLCIWRVVSDIVRALPGSADFERLIGYGWTAAGFSAASMLIYFLALMCTHMSAFRTARNMRTVAMHHLTLLPAGYFQRKGSGRLRRIIDDGAGQTESYLAHQLPDLTGAFVTPVAVVVLLFVFDWRFGLLSLLPLAIGIFFLSRMIGPDLQEKMKEYQNALEDMNNEAVEYIRGIPVVKTFQQIGRAHV